MKKLMFLLLLCVYACVCEQAHAQKTPTVVFKQESIYILQRADGSSETIFTKNKEVWYTSSKTAKKEKLITIKYKKEAGENNAANWTVAFAKSSKSLYKISVMGPQCNVTDPKGLTETFDEFEYNYKGTIGNLPIYVSMAGKCPKVGGEDEIFEGSYIYANIGTKITLIDGKCFFGGKGPSDIEFGESAQGKKNKAIFMLRNPNFNEQMQLDKQQFGTWSMNGKELQIILKGI